MKKNIATIIVLISLAAQSQATILFPKKIKIEEVKTERIESKALDPVTVGIGGAVLAGAGAVINDRVKRDTGKDIVRHVNEGIDGAIRGAEMSANTGNAFNNVVGGFINGMFGAGERP